MNNSNSDISNQIEHIIQIHFKFKSNWIQKSIWMHHLSCSYSNHKSDWRHRSNLNSLQIVQPWPPIGRMNTNTIRLTLSDFVNFSIECAVECGVVSTAASALSHTTKRVKHWDIWGVNVRDFIPSLPPLHLIITHWLQLRCVWWSRKNLVAKLMSFWMRSWNCLICFWFVFQEKKKE